MTKINGSLGSLAVEQAHSEYVHDRVGTLLSKLLLHSASSCQIGISRSPAACLYDADTTDPFLCESKGSISEQSTHSIEMVAV